jgi:hypothetical protein
MRRLIAAMKASLDGKIERTDGPADWVKAWSDDYGLTAEIDACILGGGMYPLYEKYWTSIQTDPEMPAWITGAADTGRTRVGRIRPAHAALRALKYDRISRLAEYEIHLQP